MAALDEALARHGAPKIFNTDQGAQFTSAAFTGRLEAAGIAIRWTDAVFTSHSAASIKSNVRSKRSGAKLKPSGAESATT
jgi:putative transposase